MHVREVMTPGVECVDPEDTLQQAAEKMKALNIGPLPVCENDLLVGMLTDRDITVRSTAEGQDPWTDKVRDAMTSGVVWCFDDQEVDYAAQLMKEKKLRRLVVLNRAGRMVGIVSLGDLAVVTGNDQLAGNTLEAVSEPVRPNRLVND